MSKIQLQDFVQFGQLFEIYGSLLSDDRQKIMTSYFEFNMTLAEIAQERGISRQAVLDAIQKSCEKLQFFEKNLGVCQKKHDLTQKLSELLPLCESAGQNDVKQKVENILKEI